MAKYTYLPTYQTSQILNIPHPYIPHFKPPKSQTSLVLNIPYFEHSTSQMPQILNIPHPEHLSSRASHNPNIAHQKHLTSCQNHLVHYLSWYLAPHRNKEVSSRKHQNLFSTPSKYFLGHKI